ncbi:MAG: DUF72 domain-containing protein [Syntrophotaleaceae bacterium]
MGREIRIGTSGWVYKHWKGTYYPKEIPQGDWFGYYTRDFDTVEINNTFYRLPSPETFEHWREVAPKNFLYTFKASRYITHIKRLLDPESSLDKFLERAALAAESLGPILFQLPPRWKADPDRLENFLRALPKDLVKVFEFRNDSWHAEPIRKLLERYGIAFCIHDHRSIGECPDWVTADPVYLRFHGPAEAQYSGSYSDQVLEAQAQRILVWRKEGRSIFVYFNNDVDGHAVRNALTLKSMIGRRMD